MVLIRIGAALLSLGSLGFFLCGCAGSESGKEEAAAKIHAVSLDSLMPNKQVFLKVGPDTLKNCDTASEYRTFAKVPAQGGSHPLYDAFSVKGDPILWLTFLKAAGDSIYFMATLENKDRQESYISLCVERRFIAETLVAGTPEAKREGHKSRSGHGGRRRGGGFG